MGETASELRRQRRESSRIGNYVDRGRHLAGRTFGHLLVLRYAGIKHRSSYWTCRCGCGRETEVRGSHLTDGSIVSCGCRNGGRLIGNASARWTGFGEISGSYWAQVRSGAAVRNLKFLISISDAWNLFVAQDRKCALTGLPIFFGRGKDVYGTASLDRIDNFQPYVPENIQWVHKDINTMKMRFSEERLLELCRLVISHAERKVHRGI